MSLDDAIIEAQQQNKNIIIDTYADWCIPCKKMDLEFKKPEVSSYFNEHYVNIRVNMDYSPHAATYKKKFDIVFLPTIIILDKRGSIKYKTDKFTDGKDLLFIAQKSESSSVYFLNDATDIIRDPLSQNATTAGQEVIVHKLGAPNQNPDILMKEAYFRIELMDGSHRRCASKYLETQTNWSSDKNMRFVMDFIYSVNTPEFDFFTKNLEKFTADFGQDQVKQTLEILINDELYYAYPRPDFMQAKNLLSFIYKENADQKTMEYFLERYLTECNLSHYKKMALEYINKYSSENAAVYATLGLECIVNNNTNNIDFCIDATKRATELEKNIPHYYEQLVQLYMLKGDKALAKKTLEKAIEIAKLNNYNLQYYFALKDQIQQMN